ncbi:MFS transporter [Rhodoferax sp.]|uniref:MFS transporter n=1 Tax=Rhodoferax sp. TaxID=50421 RepID=UPI0027750E37|nr:MFS transporter [Rhodoferax sp.]
MATAVSTLSLRRVASLFLAFAFAYFLSALIRAITATLSPTLSADFALNAGDLGLLAGAYFLGFATTQLPLGTWLDRFGPKRVILSFLVVAVVGCIVFSIASTFAGLIAGRILCGIGVSACLMAPLTGYRRWLAPGMQLRANSWMLMVGSLGMVASTLPVQWLMPILGWRPLFWGLGLLLMIAAGLIAWAVPKWEQDLPGDRAALPAQGFGVVWRHPYFRRMAPLGFFCYGGLMAVQTLWAVPWMTKVAGYTALEAARALFWINVAMLCTFWFWGVINPWLARRGHHADGLIKRGLPLSFVVLAIVIGAGNAMPGAVGAGLALYCVSCTFVALSQPAVAMAFPSTLAGRALTAYNLVMFAGVFAVQWGIGLAVDAFRSAGLREIEAFQASMSLFLLCCVASYGYFLVPRRDNQSSVNL